MLPASTALLLLNVQQGWDDPYWGERNNPEAESRIEALAEAFRQTRRPIIHVRHHAAEATSPFHPSEPGVLFKPEGTPLEGEKIITKRLYSCFMGTDLEAHLREKQLDRLVVAGFTTPWCVSSAARTANDLGFKTVVIHDACVAFGVDDPFGKPMNPNDLHRATLTALHGSFGVVLGARDLMRAL